MDEGLAWWLGDGDWYDLRQRRQIEDLQGDVDSAYRQAYRVRSQLSQVQGSLQNRIDRLAAAFDAFVELSDVRVDLAVYTDAAIVRHRVRLLLADVTAGRTPAPPELPDVGDYWLVPATRALYARLTGDEATAARYTGAATALDADRSRYFLAAALRLAGPVRVPAVELATLLPAAGPAPVRRAARAFWLATAAGAYGGAGQALLTSALSTALGAPPVGDGDPSTAWVSAVRGTESPGDPGRAAEALAALRRHCDSALRPADPAGGQPAGGQPAAGESTTGPGGPPVSEGGDAPDTARPGPGIEPLVGVLRSLVDEGHEPERALLRRAETLRGVVETGTAPPAYQPWDAPLGDVAELVRGDVLADPDTSPDTSPAARRVAVRAAAGWLRVTADQIAAHADTAPPDRATVRVHGATLTLGPGGADPGEVAALRRDIDAEHRSGHTRQYVGAGLAVAGLLVAAALGFAGPGGAGVGVLGIVLVLVGMGVLVRGRRADTERAEFRALQKASLQESIDRQVDALRAGRERHARQRERLAREHAALLDLLG